MPARQTERPFVIDAHQHVGQVGSVHLDEAWISEDLSRRRTRFADMGIDRCVMIPAPNSAGGFRNVDHAAMNDAVAKYARMGDDIVEAAIATVNPAEPKAACDEMERAFTQLEMPGVAFHHRYLGMQINDPRMNDLLRVAMDYQRAVFVHIISDSTFEAAWRLFALATKFSKVKFVALDGFSSANQAMMIREWAPDVPNVWFDTGCLISVAHQLDTFVELCGAERVVMGSDFYSGPTPYFRNLFPLLELQAMGLGPEELQLICSQNIRDLLSRPAQAPG